MKAHHCSVLTATALAIGMAFASAPTAQGAFVGTPGNLYVIGYFTQDFLSGGLIREFNPSTGAQVGSTGFTFGLGARDLAFGPNGNLYVTMWQANQVFEYDGASGTHVGTIASGLNRPSAIAFSPGGKLFVANFVSQQIRQYDPATGASLGVFASGVKADIGDLVFGPNGNLFVADQLTNTVKQYNPTTGAFLGVFASGGGVVNAIGMDFGFNGDLFVDGFTSRAIVRYNGTTGALLGTFTTLSGSTSPTALRFGSNGNMYLSILGGDVVWEVNSAVQVVRLFSQGGSPLVEGLTFKPMPPPPPPCAGDLDGDGVVGASDLASLLGFWGSAGPAGDLNGDGVVGAADLASLLGLWGACP